MSEEWITTKEAAKLLKTSARYVREMISKGRLKAKRDRNRWLVHSSLSAEASEAEGTPGESYRSLREMVDYLKTEAQQKDRQIETLQTQLDQSRERSDTIILQLTRQLDQSQRLLEYHQSPWWRRWFSKRGRGGNEE